jgi:hypothetical protein
MALYPSGITAQASFFVGTDAALVFDVQLLRPSKVTLQQVHLATTAHALFHGHPVLPATCHVIA